MTIHWKVTYTWRVLQTIYLRDSAPLKALFTPKESKLCHYLLTLNSSRSKPVWMYLFCRTQRMILWRKFVIRLFWGTFDFHTRNKMDLVPQNCSVSHILQNISLCVQQNKDIHTGLGWVNDRIIIFGWTIPLSLKYEYVFVFQCRCTRYDISLLPETETALQLKVTKMFMHSIV